MTSFIIAHQCPQCGAPAELEETDRLFRCDFCRVGSYLDVADFFRYTLPHKAPLDKELIYFPFWRFKGMLFSCTPRGIEKRFIDVSHQAVQSPYFPFSLGFRSQTQKLHFAAGETPGVFIKPQIPFKEILPHWTAQFSATLPKPILHQDFIGETRSLLYAPFYLEQKVMDAVLNRSVSDADTANIPADLLKPDTRNWPITFIPTLCPQCGWDLTGGRDSLSLNCTNCHTVWQARQGRLEQLNAAHIPHDDDDARYMPFWRIKADVRGADLTSYADLVKLANLPKAPQPGWDQIPFYFWFPAFKVRPQNLLTLANAFTLNQPTEQIEAGQPRGHLHPVNLPLQEAAESLKLSLAGLMRPQKRMVEKLPGIRIQARRFLLVFLPFRERPHELVHERMNLAINKNMLNLARNL